MSQPDKSLLALRAALYESAPCGLVTTHANGVLVTVNQTFCAWLGYEADELVGKRRVQDLLTIGCKIFHQTHWMPLLQIQGSVAEVQLELVHKTGHVLPALINAVRHDEQGLVRHDLAIFVAADRRKYERELLLARQRAEESLANERKAQAALAQAQARLRLARDSAQLMLWDVDPRTRTPSFETGVQRLLGLPPEREVSWQDLQARMHPDDVGDEQRAFSAALLPGGGGAYASVYRLTGHDGVERVVSSTGHAFFDDAGALVGFSGVLHDVTSWRRAERILRDQEQEARQRAVLAEQLVGIVSHDLRTPLNAVVLGAGLLASSVVTQAQRRTLGRITSAAMRATRLISDLLDFTQARLGGGLRVTRQPVDLHQLVAECVDELRLSSPGRALEHKRLGDGQGLGDADRLAQIVTNLVGNAMAYGDRERPIVITSASERGALRLEVQNFGTPIPSALLPHLFEPLRRGEQQIKLGSRSVGLGLYIVQQIVQAHGGTVEVTSSVEDGTCFAVDIPAHQPAGVQAR